MNLFSRMSIILFLFSVASCGGGGGDVEVKNKEQSNVSDITRTVDITADKDFSFTVGDFVDFQIYRFPSGYGKLNIYKNFDFHDTEKNIYYPDYTSLIASYSASVDLIYSVPITIENSFLILEWLPMDGLSNETYLRINLTGSTNYLLGF